jgi:hypothetical protein
MKKKFSIRIELELEVNSDVEARTAAENIIKELPKMEGLRCNKYRLFNKMTRKVIYEEQ